MPVYRTARFECNRCHTESAGDDDFVPENWACMDYEPGGRRRQVDIVLCPDCSAAFDTFMAGGCHVEQHTGPIVKLSDVTWGEAVKRGDPKRRVEFEWGDGIDVTERYGPLLEPKDYVRTGPDPRSAYSECTAIDRFLRGPFVPQDATELERRLVGERAEALGAPPVGPNPLKEYADQMYKTGPDELDEEEDPFASAPHSCTWDD